MKLIDKIKRLGFLKTVDDLSGNAFSCIKYKWCLLTNQVYFGSYLVAKQGKPLRHWYMQKLVEEYSRQTDTKIKILEIGSWAGGSAVTWAGAIKKYSKASGIVVCIDQWTSYLDSLDNKLWTHINMEKALKKNKIYNLFLHNITASKHEDIIFTFKGPSSQNLAMLKDNQFDIIFIDGDHFYNGVYNDIEKSVPLLKDGGIICGDDMELQYPDVDKERIKELLNSDVSVDTLTGKRFHPGVTLAVWEYFKDEVSCWEGFWAVRKNDASWERVILSIEGEITKIPVHLR